MELFKKTTQKGFTLIEMLIAMSIFVIFTGILINSYSSIVRSQRDANEYRLMYAESRRVFDGLVQELRDGMVDYGNGEYACKVNLAGGQDRLYLVSKDGQTKTLVYYDDTNQAVKVSKGLGAGVSPFEQDAVALNSTEVKVTEFQMYVYPHVDPYDQQYVMNDAYQFHPMVTIFVTFEKEKEVGEPYRVDFQTSVSSRIYNQVYSTIKCP